MHDQGNDAQTASYTSPSRRLVYLDWLRIIATLLLIPFHALEPFSLRMFYIKAPHPTYGFEVAVQTIAIWHMPLFFLIAGTASHIALERQSNKQFLATRARRLLIPFFFGILTVLPIAGYLCDNPRYGINHQSFWAYYPKFFRFHWEQIGGFTGSFTPGQLWFLLYLFFFSLIGVYVFRTLENERSRKVIDKFGKILQGFPALLFLAALPLAAVRATWAFYPQPAYYACFFLFGYCLFASRPLALAVQKCLWPAIFLVIALTPILMQLYVRRSLDTTSQYTLFPFNSITERVLVELVAVSWLISIYELARRFLNMENKLIRYLGDASIAIYVIHLSIVLGFSRLFIRFDVSNIGTYFLIAVCSVIVTLMVYEAIIRRWSIVRVLFGMKAHPPQDIVYLPSDHVSTDRSGIS